MSFRAVGEAQSWLLKWVNEMSSWKRLLKTDDVVLEYWASERLIVGGKLAEELLVINYGKKALENDMKNCSWPGVPKYIMKLR